MKHVAKAIAPKGNTAIIAIKRIVERMISGVDEHELYNYFVNESIGKDIVNHDFDIHSVFIHDTMTHLFRFDFKYDYKKKLLKGISVNFYSYMYVDDNPWITITDIEKIKLIVSHIEAFNFNLQALLDNFYGMYRRVLDNVTTIDEEMHLLLSEYDSRIVKPLLCHVGEDKFMVIAINEERPQDCHIDDEASMHPIPIKRTYAYGLDKNTSLDITFGGTFDIKCKGVSLRRDIALFYNSLVNSDYVIKHKEFCSRSYDALMHKLRDEDVADIHSLENIMKEYELYWKNNRPDGITISDDNVVHLTKEE